MLNQHDIERMKSAFFELSQSGWAFGVRPQTDHSTLTKYLVAGNKNFVLRDEWHTGTEGHFAGSVTLTGATRGFWRLNYYGVIPRRLVPLVKAAVAHSHRKGEFRAGRGSKNFGFPHGHELFDFVYQNDANTMDVFEYFNARESIVLRSDPRSELGWCLVHGGLLGGVAHLV